MGVRDRGAARLVCRHWRSAVDGLTVRRLALRSPGPSNCALLLPRRFPLLQFLALGSAVTSSRAAFASALAALPALGQLSRLSLEFTSPAAIRLPSSLHSLSRLQSLSVSVSAVQQGQVGPSGGAPVSATGGEGGGVGADDVDGTAPIRSFQGAEVGGSGARAVSAESRALFAPAAGGASGGRGGGSGGGAAGEPLQPQPHQMRNFTFAFAVLLAAGGAAAFVRKGSAKSLGAAGGAALILGLCARAMVGPAAQGPARVAFGICTLLGVAMASRFNSSKKFMPAGLVALASLSMAVAFVVVGL